MPEKIGLEAVLIEDDFVAGVKNYNAGIDSMEAANKSAVQSSAALSDGLGATDEALAQSGKSAIDMAAKIDIAKNALAAAQKIIGTGLELAKLGAQAERVEQRFAAFAEEAGGADAILRAFQDGAGGAASKMEGMVTASRLLQMGLVEDAAGMERVVEMATRLGDQTQGVTDRVSDFALMLANQSIPRLDNFGISSGKVRARIAELQDATEGMTREAAFMQAVMEQGGQSLEKLGPRAEDGLMAFEKMEAQIADLKVEIAQGLLPAFSALLGIVSDILSIASPLVQAFGEIAAGTERMKAATAEAETAASSLGDEVRMLVAGGMSLADATAVATGRINKSTEAWNKASNVQKGAIALLGQGGEFTDAMSAATGSLESAVRDSAGSFDEYIATIKQHNETVKDGVGQITALSESQFEMRKRIQDSQQNWADLTEEQQANTLAALKQADAYYTAGDGIERLTHEQRLASSISIEEAANTDRLANLRERGVDAARAQAGTVSLLAGAQEAAAASAQRAADAQTRQADVAARQAENLAAAQAASDALADSQGNLMVQLAGATEEQFKQNVFAQIDPSDIGLDAYADLGVELGVLDEKAADLATSVPILIEAYENGIVPTENMAAATEEIFEAAGNANFEVEELLDKYSRAPGLIGPSKEEQEALNERLELTAEIAPDASEGIDGVGVSAEESKGSVQELNTEIDILIEKMELLKQASQQAFGSSAQAQATAGRARRGQGTPGQRGSASSTAAGAFPGTTTTSTPAVGTFGGVTQTSTVNNFNDFTSTANFSVPSELAATMLADSLRQSRRDRFDA
jgi:hypothetical protein